jgi:hypothetical protein
MSYAVTNVNQVFEGRRKASGSSRVAIVFVIMPTFSTRLPLLLCGLALLSALSLKAGLWTLSEIVYVVTKNDNESTNVATRMPVVVSHKAGLCPKWGCPEWNQVRNAWETPYQQAADEALSATTGNKWAHTSQDSHWRNRSRGRYIRIVCLSSHVLLG